MNSDNSALRGRVHEGYIFNPVVSNSKFGDAAVEASQRRDGGE